MPDRPPAGTRSRPARRSSTFLLTFEFLLLELGQELTDFLGVRRGFCLATAAFFGLARDLGRLLRLEALADFVGRQLTQGLFEGSLGASRADPLWRLFVALGSTGSEFLFGDLDIGCRLFVAVFVGFFGCFGVCVRRLVGFLRGRLRVRVFILDPGRGGLLDLVGFVGRVLVGFSGVVGLAQLLSRDLFARSDLDFVVIDGFDLGLTIVSDGGPGRDVFCFVKRILGFLRGADFENFLVGLDDLAPPPFDHAITRRGGGDLLFSGFCPNDNLTGPALQSLAGDDRAHGREIEGVLLACNADADRTELEDQLLRRDAHGMGQVYDSKLVHRYSSAPSDSAISARA